MVTCSQANLTSGTPLTKNMLVTSHLHWLGPERWDNMEGLTGRRVRFSGIIALHMVCDAVPAATPEVYDEIALHSALFTQEVG